jgi:hypothetical protein
MSFDNETEDKLKFTTTMKLFIEDIQLTFPEFKDILTPLLVDINNKDVTSKYINKLIKDSVEIYTPLIYDILNKRENIFYDTNIDSHFIPNIDFKDLWGLDITDNIKESIWEYLRLISMSVMKMAYKPPNIMESSNSVITPPEDKSIDKTRNNIVGRKEIKQNLHFNTKFRENFPSSSSSDFIINLPIECTNVSSLSLSSISIPNIIYTFSEAKANNTFIIVDKDDVHHTITIPYGIYSVDDLTTFLNNTYFARNSLLLEDTKFPNLKFGVNSGSLKSYFISTETDGSSTTIKKIIFAKDNYTFLQSAGYILGFRKFEYTVDDFINATFVNMSENITNYEYLNLPSSINDGLLIDTQWQSSNITLKPTPFLVSESTYNASGDYFIYFALDDFVQNTQSSNIVFFKDSIMKYDVLAKIYLGQGLYLANIDASADDLNSQSKTRIYPGPVNIKKIHITLLDEVGNIIDLNGMDVTFSFEITRII